MLPLSEGGLRTILNTTTTNPLRQIFSALSFSFQHVPASADREGGRTNAPPTTKGFLTGKKGDVSVLGVVRTARHPADLLSQSVQGVRLGSETRSKVRGGSKQCGGGCQTKQLLESRL